MSVNNAALLNNPDENAYSVPLFYNYSYDQLNRIKNMTAFSGLNTEDNGWQNPETNDDYSESVSYDPNGNIIDYNRNGSIHAAPDRAMDNLHYDYIPGTNKLLHVSDLPGNDGNYPDDIDNQEASENYTYDQIGNLVHDESRVMITVLPGRFMVR